MTLRPMVSPGIRQCRRAGMATMAALLLIPVIAAIGIAVDLTRLWLVQSRLQTAVDAAALVAARQMNTTSAAAEATALFWSNFGRTEATGMGFLGATAATPVVEKVNNDTMQVRATATLGVTLMNMAGQGAQTVRAEASAKRAVLGMELALVLDITGSMEADNNIGGLRTAATDLVSIVFGPKDDTQPNLFVSVVPYVASVNFGKERTGWLAPGTLDQSEYKSVKWAGCVEARAGGEDRTDTPPTAAPFHPFLWRSTSERYYNGTTPVPGDNDWTASKITEEEPVGNDTVGPNLSCPRTPVVPLTASKSAVLTAVKSLKATHRGGTMGNLGLQAGWFTLSPRWTGLWGTAGSPLPYKTPNMQKVVVMMTDGDNQWYDWPGGAPGNAPSKTYDGKRVDADYTAYGRLSENRLGATNSLATTEINARTALMCDQMKKEGIIIYTVLLGALKDGTNSLWRNCASKPENYFSSSDKTAMAAAFKQIGTQLAGLRLSQ